MAQSFNTKVSWHRHHRFTFDFGFVRKSSSVFFHHQQFVVERSFHSSPKICWTRCVEFHRWSARNIQQNIFRVVSEWNWNWSAELWYHFEVKLVAWTADVGHHSRFNEVWPAARLHSRLQEHSKARPRLGFCSTLHRRCDELRLLNLNFIFHCTKQISTLITGKTKNRIFVWLTKRWLELMILA